jgi:multimeric flavodoxin WrbA
LQGRPEIYDLTKGDYEMKVLILNGSPRVNGNTDVAVNELVKTFEAEGVGTVVSRIGNQNIRGCIACGSCTFICPARRPLMQLFKQTKAEILAERRAAAAKAAAEAAAKEEKK